MKAFTQGYIDYFCGVYSCINAFRLAYRDTHEFKYEEGTAMYQHLLRTLIKDGTISEVVECGMRWEIMDTMLQAVDDFARQTYGVKVSYERPFADKQISFSGAIAQVNDYIKQPQAACMFRFYNSYIGDHWTVPKRIVNNGTQMRLFDSWNYDEGFDLRKAEWAPYKKDGKIHIMQDHVVFLKLSPVNQEQRTL